ncbi:hypothetical protein NX059_011919 [Plenodomus lindquistii]|nr:hypothetical protein NX059_011919 [Plenodomus lindquistii]
MSPPTPPSILHSPHTSPTELTTLLKHKLRAIPPYHLPTLTLTDILQQSCLATHIPNIPPDIQLPFFLRHRALIALADDRPLKSEEAQSSQLTRAIWFYRLDSTRQFQRYHDGVRWNLAMFVALLAISSRSADVDEHNVQVSSGDQALPGTHAYRTTPHPTDPRITTKDSYIPLSPSATRFITLYLAAVLEHHNTPLLFPARDSFIRFWKATRWDVFTVPRAVQKKILKSEMKRLGREWEGLLDEEMQRLGRRAYDGVVGRFVGCVVPGRKDQGCRGVGGLNEVREDGREVVGEYVGMEGMEDKEGGGNELLDALRVPFSGQRELGRLQEEEASMVAELRYAIAAVQKVTAREILSVLVRLFPVEQEEVSVKQEEVSVKQEGPSVEDRM